MLRTTTHSASCMLVCVSDRGHFFFSLSNLNSVSQMGRSKVGEMFRSLRCVFMEPSFRISSLSGFTGSLNRDFARGYFTFFEQRAVLTLLIYPWLLVSGRTFVHLISNNSPHSCVGFKWGCHAEHFSDICTHSVLICGLHGRSSNGPDPRCCH